MSDLKQFFELREKRTVETGLALSNHRVNHQDPHELALDFNVILKKLSGIIRSIRQTSDAASVSISQLNTAAIELTTSSREQSLGMVNMAAVMRPFSDGAYGVSDSLKGSNENAIDSKTFRGSVLADRISNYISKVVTGPLSMSRKIQMIVEHSEQISAIILLIQQMSKRTHLKVLNSSLNSVRSQRFSGELIDEITDLGQLTKPSVLNIAEILNKIKRLVEVIDQDAVRHSNHVSELSRFIRLAKKYYSEIDTVSIPVKTAFDEILKFLSEQNEVTCKVMLSVKAIAAECDASFGKMDDLLQSSNYLLSRAEALGSVIDKFKSAEVLPAKVRIIQPART